MMDDDQDAVPTVPPPPGEDDPYCAKTKVGALADEILREKMISMRREILARAPPEPSAPPEPDMAGGKDTARVSGEVDDDLMRARGALITPPNADRFMLTPPKQPPSRAGLVMLVVALVGIGVLVVDALIWFAT